MSSTNKSCLKSQVKIINLIDSDCPRLNSSVVVRRTRRFFKWSPGPGQITIFPRISRECSRKKTKRPKQKPRLSGFFQAQLRMMKALKQQKDEDNFDFTVRFDDVQCEEYCKLEFLPGLTNHDAWFVLSYGLICMSTIRLPGRDHNRNIYLWNPLIKKYKTLPESPLPSAKNWEAWEAFAFGFLPEVDDYVVIHIIKPCLPPHPQSVIIGVYSLKTNSWKKSSQDNVFISGISSDQDDVVFINGAAFWVGVNSDKQIILMCFDTKTDTLCEISLPDSVAYWSQVPVIHQFGQSIAYFVWEEGVNHFDMWVLKYDHINEFTWEKKMCVSPSKDVEEEVLGVRNTGDPILVISYSLDCHQANGFVESWDRWTPNSPYKVGYGPPYVIRPFVESLVMLND
ncbi:F-box domain-containing protein [Heracleum sosnowskyi]|uniref:F-box domain-containing protein n=1 Tax=Heracleum sosnowskyi TaxID=360622 RepID=A0AAD8HS23_9APIA|nr:F-box domain-containing protein [Heracleum sosnowskyi]